MNSKKVRYHLGCFQDYTNKKILLSISKRKEGNPPTIEFHKIVKDPVFYYSGKVEIGEFIFLTQVLSQIRKFSSRTRINEEAKHV